MASPSAAEIRAQINAVVDLLNETYLFASQNAENFVDLEDAVVQSMEGDFADQVLAAVSTMRGYLNSAVSSTMAAALLGPLFQSYAKVLDIPFRDIPSIFKELSEYMVGASEDVLTRTMVFGSISAGGGNVGTGTINRLTTDELGYDIENATAEGKTAKCVRDERSGAIEHEESFLVYGKNAEKDVVELTGSGKNTEIKAVSARNVSTYVQNPSFEDFTGSVGALTALAGWTVAGSIANLDVDQTNYYRSYRGSQTPTALQFDAAEKITQALSIRKATFDPRVPYYAQIAYNRSVGSGAATLTIRVGANSKSVVLAAQSGWNILRLDLDENLFFDNWNETDADVEIEISSYSSGSILVDDLILHPMFLFDGLWWLPVGGATKFLRDDVFTWTDSETGAKVQEWLRRAFGTYLPHDASPTWVDP